MSVPAALMGIIRPTCTPLVSTKMGMPVLGSRHVALAGMLLPSSVAAIYRPRISDGHPNAARIAVQTLLMRNSFKCNQFP